MQSFASVIAACLSIALITAHAGAARAQGAGGEGDDAAERADEERSPDSADGEAADGAEGRELADDEPALLAHVRALRRELAREREAREQLEAEIEDLDAASAARREAVSALEAALEREREAKRELEARTQELEGFRAEVASEHDYLTERFKEVERNYPTRSLEEPDSVKLGGALWMNYAYRSFSASDRRRAGELGFDLFRLTADGAVGGVLVSAQYRFYSYMQAIHHAWLGFAPRDDLQIRLGVDQAPFGLLPYASHSYWSGAGLYLGLQDSYSTGARAIFSRGPWNVQIAAFKGAAPAIRDPAARSSFAPVAPSGDPRGNEVTTQANARAAYTLSGAAGALELGASAQWGRLEHGETTDTGSHWAGALHASGFKDGWNAQLQLTRYAYAPAVDAGGLVTFAGFGATRAIAARGLLAVANLAKSFPVEAGPLESVTCYEDWSAVFKDRDAFDTSWLSTTGCALELGPTYTYVDGIVGKNMTFLGDSLDASGLGPGGAEGPELRFNVNLEYFF